MTEDELKQLSPDDLDLLAKSLMLKALYEMLLGLGIAEFPQCGSLEPVARELQRRVYKQPFTQAEEGLNFEDLPF